MSVHPTNFRANNLHVSLNLANWMEYDDLLRIIHLYKFFRSVIARLQSTGLALPVFSKRKIDRPRTLPIYLYMAHMRATAAALTLILHFFRLCLS